MKNALFQALPNAAFLAGLGLAVAAATAIGPGVPGARAGLAVPASPTALQPMPGRGIDREDMADARAAWSYFRTNVDPVTGLAPAVAGFPSTTLWDQAGHLLALVSAERLGILPRDEFDARLSRLLDTLARLPLYDGKLPNKVYDITTLAMTDYANAPVAGGIGWSALDICRLLAALGTVVVRHPDHADAVRRVVARFDLDALVGNGVLYGAIRDPETGATQRLQEGRLGYEEYAARAAMAFGLDATEALRVDDHLDIVRTAGVAVPTDARRRADFGVNRYTLSEPYLLMAFEFGLDTQSRELAWRVFAAQRARAERRGRLTAVSEDHLDRDPSFVYSAVVGNGVPWAVLDESGARHDELRTLSAKAAIGWAALFDTDYGRELARAVRVLRDPRDGFAAGIYESDGSTNTAVTLNTNAVILEAVHFKAFGPLLQWTQHRR